MHPLHLPHAHVHFTYLASFPGLPRLHTVSNHKLEPGNGGYHPPLPPLIPGKKSLMYDEINNRKARFKP